MDRRTCWDITVAVRLALRAHLRSLTAEQWDHPSLCAGWRVRDVAGHVISSPQMTWRATAALVPGLLGGYNATIARDGRRRGCVPVGEILAQFDRWASVRRGPVTTTHVEPLLDALVHTQDILRPLGIDHHMPADAAAIAADRCRVLASFLGSRHLLRRVRLVATDAPWDRGRGPCVRGPME